MDRLRIRRAEPADAEAIARIHVETWQWAYKDILPAEYLGQLSIPQRTENWKRHLDTVPPDIFVAEDKGIIGFCASGPARDPDSREEDGELYAIYVHPDCMRQGAGGALIGQALDTLRTRGFARAGLWVLAGNTVALEFYKKHGWRIDGRTKTEVVGGGEFEEIGMAYPIQLPE